MMSFGLTVNALRVASALWASAVPEWTSVASVTANSRATVAAAPIRCLGRLVMVRLKEFQVVVAKSLVLGIFISLAL